MAHIVPRQSQTKTAHGATITDKTTSVIHQKVREMQLISNRLQVQTKEKLAPPTQINH